MMHILSGLILMEQDDQISMMDCGEECVPRNIHICHNVSRLCKIAAKYIYTHVQGSMASERYFGQLPKQLPKQLSIINAAYFSHLGRHGPLLVDGQKSEYFVTSIGVRQGEK